MYYGRLGSSPQNPHGPLDPVYYVLMNQTETNAFFRALHDLEDVHNTIVNDADPDYIEGYDCVMDDVKDAILAGDVENMYDLDNFVNHMDAFAEDNEPGTYYANGYQDAVDMCLEALSQLLTSE